MSQLLHRTGSATLLLMLATGAPLAAQDLPTPILIRADPQMVYAGSPGWLDSNGRVAVVIYGENLAPNDGDNGHPSGPDGGYQHIFIRGVSPHGDKASPWVPATVDNGCLNYGSASRTALSLGIDPARYLSEPGSHLQVKLWVSLSVTSASDPVGSGSFSSGWSAIKTIDVAPAGATKPVVVSAPSAPPVIHRIVPSDFSLGPSTQDYRLRIYGTFATGACQVIFNGDSGAPVPGEDAAVGYEMTPNWTSTGGDMVFHVTIPAKYRRTTPGQLRIAVLDSGGRTTGEKTVTFTAMAVKATGRPSLPGVPNVSARVQPGVNPALAPKVMPGAPVPPSRFEGFHPEALPLPRIPEAPPEAIGRWQRLTSRLRGRVRARYDLVRMQAVQTLGRPGTDPESTVRGLVRQQFPTASGMDIEALTAMVLMECAQASEQDLRDTLASMDQTNKAKQAQRDRIGKLRGQEQRLQAQAAAEARTPPPPPPVLRRPVPVQGPLKVPPALLHPVEPSPNLSREQLDAEAAKVRNDLDSLGDLSQALQTRLQLQMDQRAKVLQAASNLMKKIASTESSVIGNLK